MDVNEKIIEEYLKVQKKWFYMADLPVEVPSNYSNIDLLAYDPQKGKYYDIEIKFRSAFVLTLDGNEYNKFVAQLIRPERQALISKITGSKKKVEKIFVTTY